MNKLSFAVVAIAGFFFLPTLASAQTVTWTQTNVASAAQAQGFTYKLYVTPALSTTQNPAVVLTAVTCTGTGSSVPCTGTVAAPTSMITGAKDALSATDPVSATESAQSAPFSPGANVPTGLKVQ